MDESDLDRCGDKTSCSTALYGEAGEGVIDRKKNQTEVNKGVQPVIITKFKHTSRRA